MKCRLAKIFVLVFSLLFTSELLKGGNTCSVSDNASAIKTVEKYGFISGRERREFQTTVLRYSLDENSDEYSKEAFEVLKLVVKAVVRSVQRASAKKGLRELDEKSLLQMINMCSQSLLMPHVDSVDPARSGFLMTLRFIISAGGKLGIALARDYYSGLLNDNDLKNRTEKVLNIIRKLSELSEILEEYKRNTYPLEYEAQTGSSDDWAVAEASDLLYLRLVSQKLKLVKNALKAGVGSDILLNAQHKVTNNRGRPDLSKIGAEEYFDAMLR